MIRYIPRVTEQRDSNLVDMVREMMVQANTRLSYKGMRF